MKLLLDTGILIGALKGRLPVVLKLSQLKPGEVAVSVIGKLEAELGLRRESRLQARYGKLLREFLASVTVLDIDAAAGQQAVNVAAFGTDGLSGMDLLLAATALSRNLVLVTDRPEVFLQVPNLELQVWR